MVTVAEVAAFLDRFAPPRLAAEWDNVGLLLGDLSVQVTKIMTCLTVTPDSAAEALAEHAQLIVAHHPILFRPVKRLTTATAESRMLLDLIRGGVAVYSPHTAFDNTAGGINELLAQKLGLTQVTPLRRAEGPRSCKIVAFVPDADLAKVSDAMFAAGAGRIGDYGECSFRLAGTGTFFGADTTNPTVGQKGRREDVSEWRLEVVCPESLVSEVVAGMKAAHSYEEPAFDVYPLRSEESTRGVGRLGSLPKPTTLQSLAQTIKTQLSARCVQIVGEPGKSVRRVAIVCGAGGEFVSEAAAAGADVLVTGEARFHDALAAQAHGIGLILPGHFATERCGVEDLARRLAEQFPSLQVWPARREADPLQEIE